MADENKASEAAEVQAQGTDEDQKNTANKGENIVEAKGEQGPGAVFNLHDLSFLSEPRTDLPDIRPGMQIRVFYRVIEGGKERTQVFEGAVIAIKNSGISKTITVRKTSFGIAVERIFPLNSKLVQKIEMKKRQKVRRAKLYYLKNLKGKAARLKELR
jgi:large subunit ribosomal protein L19